MAYDSYDAMLSGSPTDPAKQAALAAQLRQQAMLGRMGMLTGDRVMGPGGTHLMSEADSQGKELMSDREAQARLQEAVQAHQDSMAQSNAQMSQHMAIAKMQDARMRELQQDRLDARTDTAAKKPGKPIPASAAKEMEQFQDSARGVDEALTSLKSLNDAGINTGGMLRDSRNYLAANTPFATDEDKAVQNWHANYGRQFTLPELKATIGIRHNQYMQNLFESYHLAPNMSNDQKLENLQQISKQLHDRITTRAKDYASQGYDVGNYTEFPAAGAAPPPGSVPGKGAPTAPVAPTSDDYLLRARAKRQQPQPQPQPMAPGPYNLNQPSGNMFSGMQ